MTLKENIKHSPIITVIVWVLMNILSLNYFIGVIDNYYSLGVVDGSILKYIIHSDYFIYYAMLNILMGLIFWLSVNIYVDPEMKEVK